MHPPARTRPSTVLLLVTGAVVLGLTACGGGTSSDAGSTAAGSSSPSAQPSPTRAPGTATVEAPAQDGVAPADAALDLGELTHTVPSGWTAYSADGLSYAVPPGTTPPTQETAPDSAGRAITRWPGPGIPLEPGADPAEGQASMTFVVAANPGSPWDGSLPADQGTTFTATVPGVPLVGGTIAQSSATVDAEGHTKPVSEIDVYLQGTSGGSYSIHLTTTPGEGGVRFLTEFLSTVSIP